MSNIPSHISGTGPGVVGTSIAGSFTLVGFINTSLPVLQAISLLIGSAVGIMTFVYYYRKVKAEQTVAVAKIASDTVKATAKIAAEALKEMNDK